MATGRIITGRTMPAVSKLPRRAAFFSFALVCCAGAWYAGTSMAKRTAASSTVKNEIHVEPALVEFGEIEPGKSASAKIRIINGTNKPFIVSRTTTSCPCLALEPRTPRLEPGETVDAELRLDMAYEPRFTGGLLMTVSVFDGDGERALSLSAKVRVKRPL